MQHCFDLDICVIIEVTDMCPLTYTNLPRTCLNALQLKDFLTAMNMMGVPAMVSEDNSAAQPHLDTRTKKGQIHLYGVNGGVHVVHSSSDVIEKVHDLGLANAMYAYSLIFLSRHGVYLPILCVPNDGSNRTLSKSQVRRWRRRILSGLLRHGIHVLGTVSDGASTMRRVLALHWLSELMSH
jgi:hypothetical protein